MEEMRGQGVEMGRGTSMLLELATLPKLPLFTNLDALQSQSKFSCTLHSHD